jgi:hypothetical protein
MAGAMSVGELVVFQVLLGGVQAASKTSAFPSRPAGSWRWSEQRAAENQR